MVFKESGGKTSCRQQIEYKSYQAVQKLTANVWGRNERTIEPWEIRSLPTPLRRIRTGSSAVELWTTPYDTCCHGNMLQRHAIGVLCTFIRENLHQTQTDLVSPLWRK